MEDLEKDLGTLKFTPPPQWAKARSLMAAENVLRAQARRSRMRCIAVGVAAAAISLVVVGTYIADAIAPMAGRGGPYLQLRPQTDPNMMGQDYMPGMPQPVRPVRPPAVSDDAAQPTAESGDAEEAEKKEKKRTPEEDAGEGAHAAEDAPEEPSDAK